MHFVSIFFLFKIYDSIKFP